MSGRLFVTGAASFLAGALLPAARARRFQVTGIDLAPPPADGLQAGDICASDLADALPQDADAVVHLAALSRDEACRGRLYESFDVNVMGSLNVARAARQRRARQLILASTEWVYGAAAHCRDCTEDDVIDAAGLQSEYALSKLTAELALRRQCAELGLPLAVLRFGIIYGERPANWGAVESLVHQVIASDTVTVGSRATARRYLHVEDVAAAICHAVGQRAEGTYNIVGPRLVTLGEVIATAAEQTGRQPQIQETAPGRPSIRRISAEKATGRLGWQAAIGIEDGIARLAGYFGVPGTRTLAAAGA